MHIRARLAAALAGGAILALAGVTAVSAIVIPPGPLPIAKPQKPGTTAVTQVSNRTDNGGGGAWAQDQFTRVLTVTADGPVSPSLCGGHIFCQGYSAQISDGGNASGYFATIPGALSPNQSPPFTGLHIHGQTSGGIVGNATFGEFYTDSLVAPTALLVPTTFSGNGVSTSAWPSLEWAPGTPFWGMSADEYGWTYRTTISHQVWIDSSADNDGQSFLAGNITG